MTTPLTGSLGWSGLYPVQLGGPPLVNTYSRPLATSGKPLLAHIYDNDGVSFKGTLPVLQWSSIKATTANGGYDQVTLSLAFASTMSIYGDAVYGLNVYDGQLIQGNVVRLTEVGGPWNGFVFSGVVEDIPDTITPTSVSHNVLLTHFAFELDDVQSVSVYAVPTDISQMVRDAVAQTFHCSCDSNSVPVSTGIFLPQPGGVIDFRNQTVKQQIDTCRSLAGPTWYWYVDELGRVWFQTMGSAAVYTLMRGPHYEQRTSSASIQNRKNRVVAVGGVPTGGSANAVGTYNGISQATLGIRALFPVLALPNISDPQALQFIANNIGVVLDRVWRQINVMVHSPFPQRIHGSQPGGAMLRYWEPASSPIPESESGMGKYTGPFIVNSVEWDGLHQTVVAGDIPLTSQTDINNMVNSLTGRVAANALQVTGAALNLRQTFTGSFQSGSGTITSSGVPATLWQLDQQEFRAIDPNGISRAEMGDLLVNGVSPAQWGFRANDANGNPIFDSLGLIAAMSTLVNLNSQPSTYTTSVTTPTLIPGSTANFTLARPQTLLFIWMGGCEYGAPNTATAFLDLVVDGVDLSNGTPSPAIQIDYPATTTGAVTSTAVYSASLAAGAHTVALNAFQDGTTSFTLLVWWILVFQLGS